MKSTLSLLTHLLASRFRKSGGVTVHAVQISKLRWAVLFPEDALLFESKRDGRLSLIGGLCQTRREEDIPVIALLREIRQKLGIESGLTEPDHTKLVWRKNFNTEAGLQIRFHSDGWVQIGYAFRYRVDGHIDRTELGFGITLATHSFEVIITRDWPADEVPQALAGLVVGSEQDAQALRERGVASNLWQLLWRAGR